MCELCENTWLGNVSKLLIMRLEKWTLLKKRCQVTVFRRTHRPHTLVNNFRNELHLVDELLIRFVFHPNLCFCSARMSSRKVGPNVRGGGERPVLKVQGDFPTAAHPSRAGGAA